MTTSRGNGDGLDNGDGRGNGDGNRTATATTADKYYHGGQVDDNVELSKTTASKTTRLLG